MDTKKHGEQIRTKEDHDAFAERLRGTSQAAENVLENGAEELAPGEEFQAVISTAVELAQSTFQLAQEEIAAGAKAADETIRKYPYPAMGVAFGIGLVAAYLLKEE